MCENFKQFIGVLFLLFVVLPIVVFIWVPYVANLGGKLNSDVKSEVSYITSHHCATENSLVIDGTTKVRYLCNAQSDDERVATD